MAEPIQRAPEILGGTPTFRGTRVPVRTLFDYLQAGDSLALFHEDFPSVSEPEVIEVLELASKIRLPSKDLRGLHKRALAEGISYHTLVASILDEYVEGRLVDSDS
jgi:Uncharacterized conserved protein